MKPKISIIIPVYNAEQYLAYCLESVITQDYSNFEVLLVNDGSTDNSGLICRQYSDRDSRFKFIDGLNHGVSHARNLGLSKASGDWITFVDSDDWIENDYLSTLVSHITEGVDVVVANLFFNYKNGLQTRCICTPDGIHKSQFSTLAGALMVGDYAKKDGIDISCEILSAACDKLTRKSLIDRYQIRFNEDLHLNEDGLFHLQSYLKAKDIFITNKPIYHYRLYNESSNNKYRPDISKQMDLWHANFGRTMEDQPNKDDFMSLCAYRAYTNLSLLYIDNPKHIVPFNKKISLLESYIKSPTYAVYTIPKGIRTFKKIEMFLLKHRLVTLLFFFTHIKGIIKNKLR